MAQKNAKLIIDEQSKEYWRWRDSILTYEELMLETLTFDLMVDNPYQSLYEHLRRLNLTHNKRLKEAAWAFCNDSCLTVLPLLMEARDLSISAIFFAASVTHEKVDDVDGEAWWTSLGGNEDLMTKAVETISEFYAENPLRKQLPTHPSSPVFNFEGTRRSGESMLSQTEAGSSHNGTPMGADRGAQSPGAGLNGKGPGNGEAQDHRREASYEANTDSRADAARGDSDAALKAAANNLSVHQGRPNGNSIRSPGMKRSNLDLDQDSDGERASKRVRTDDEDEGEVH